MANYKGKYIKLINNKFVDDRIIIKDHEPEPLISKMKIHYICDICREDYISGGPIRKGYTHFCRKHTFHYVCDWCHEEFQITRLSDFISDKDLRFCCRNHALQYRNRTPEMVQAVIDKNIRASKESLSIDRVCIVCDRHFKSAMPNDICNSCITTYTNYETGTHKQECLLCGSKFYSPFKMDACPTCLLGRKNNTKPTAITYELSIIGLALGKLSQAEFNKLSDFFNSNNQKEYSNLNIIESTDRTKEIIDNIIQNNIYYDQQNKNKLQLLEKRLIDRENKRLKRLEELKYRAKFISKSTTFKQIDGVKYVYSNKDHKYVIWDDFKLLMQDSQKITDQFGFQMIRTFREQNSDSWGLSKSIFEEYLKDLKVRDFVYIKYYIDQDENLKPLVVGITGSKFVNGSGTDISFDYSQNGGPARQFLIETGLDWLKTHVSIFPTSSRDEALQIESLIASKYNILMS